MSLAADAKAQRDSRHGVMTAEALWFVAPREVVSRPEDVPPPAAGHVRVQALASAISHGTEMLIYHGEAPGELPLDLPTLSGSYAFPIKFGYASVGRVLDVGQDVERPRPGDLVFTLHPHQTVFVVPATLPVTLPDDLDPLLGAFTANLETALNITHDAPLRLGETVVVFGLGVVGLLVAQLVRRAGAGHVIGVDPLASRRDLSRRLGIDVAVAPGDELTSALRALTDGRGADVAIEVSGASAALQAAIDAVAVEGTVVVASWYGTKPAQLMLGGHFHRGRVTLRSSQVGRLNPALTPRWDYERRLATVVGLLPHMRLGELISQRVPFRVAPDAYRLIDEHPDEVVQVVLIYDPL